MTRDSDLPVLIIGAGIGGLATAIALQQAGFQVRVFERVNEIKEVGAGLVLGANAVRILQKLGLDDILRNLGMPKTVVGGIYSDSGKQLSLLSATEVEQKLGAWIVTIHRAELQAALQEKLERDTLMLGAKLINFEQDESGVTAYFADGQQARGCLLVGADGIHSSVRSQLFPQSKLRYAGYTAWRGITFSADSQLAREMWGRGIRFGMVPLTKERVYWFATRNAPKDEVERPEGRQKELLETFKGWHPEVTALIETTSPDAILRNDIYDLKPLSCWNEGRVTLVGDAAHAMTPNLGQGACQALEDAFILAHSLSHVHPISAALQCYQQTRLTRANMIVTRSRNIGIVAQWEHPFACWLRNHLLTLTPSRVLVKQIEDVAGYKFDTDANAHTC